MDKYICPFVIFILFFAASTSWSAGECFIFWDGDFSGQVSTTQTSRTAQAAEELHDAIPWERGDCSGDAAWLLNGCFGHECSGVLGSFWLDQFVCPDGTWREDYADKTCQYLPDEPCSSDQGTWDVICDDSDTDGIVDLDDNCPGICNPQQLDADEDGIGDLCDQTPGCVDDPGCGMTMCEEQDQCDTDNDGIVDANDNCPQTCNDQQLDADEDGVGDVCDQTPHCVDDPGCGLTMCEEVCMP
jgi:hypothetical protein